MICMAMYQNGVRVGTESTLQDIILTLDTQPDGRIKWAVVAVGSMLP